jgi:hypothetical protein
MCLLPMSEFVFCSFTGKKALKLGKNGAWAWNCQSQFPNY